MVLKTGRKQARKQPVVRVGVGGAWCLFLMVEGSFSRTFPSDMAWCHVTSSPEVDVAQKAYLQALEVC